MNPGDVVWVLTLDAGYGDGWCVLGVFSTREAACASHPDFDWWHYDDCSQTRAGYEVTRHMLDEPTPL